MKSKIRVLFLVCMFSLVLFGLGLSVVKAAGDLEVFESGSTVEDLVDGDLYSFDTSDMTGRVEGFVKLGVSLVFVSIVLSGFFLIGKAVVKIILSEGKPEGLEGGLNSIKSVWTGIAMIFIGILGVVLIIVFFNAGDLFNVSLEKPEGFTGDIPFVN